MFFLDFQEFNETQIKVNIELAKGWISIRNSGYNNRRHQKKGEQEMTASGWC